MRKNKDSILVFQFSKFYLKQFSITNTFKDNCVERSIITDNNMLILLNCITLFY